MGNYGSDLISSKPTTNYKENDRQAEANNQKRRINSAEHLLDKQRENSGVDRNQTREGDWEQTACREQCSNDDDDKAGRQHHREKKRSRDPAHCRCYNGNEGQGYSLASSDTQCDGFVILVVSLVNQPIAARGLVLVGRGSGEGSIGI